MRRSARFTLVTVFALLTALGPAVADDQPKPKNEITPQSVCTEKARRDKVKGWLTVEVTVDTKGKVIDARVVESLSSDVDKGVVKAAKRLKFEPARKDGKPVMVKANIKVSIDCTE